MTIREAIASAIDDLAGFALVVALFVTCRAATCVEHLANDRFLAACVEMKHEPQDCRIALRDDLEVATRTTPLEPPP